jgi:hypothetical protein
LVQQHINPDGLYCNEFRRNQYDCIAILECKAFAKKCMTGRWMLSKFRAIHSASGGNCERCGRNFISLADSGGMLECAARLDYCYRNGCKNDNGKMARDFSGDKKVPIGELDFVDTHEPGTPEWNEMVAMWQKKRAGEE